MMVQIGSNPMSKEQVMAERKKQKKKKKDEQNDSDDGGDELDLSKELFPLSHYAGDPVELINQVFSTITDPKMTALLPPILKGINLSEIKHDCLHELSGMSKKRILCVINGQEMEGSSGSEEDEEDEEKEKESPVKGKSQQGSLKRPIPSKEAAAAALLKKIKEEPVSDDEVQERDPVTGKSVMELLELEMRARIIKTMLDKGEAKGVLTEEMVSKVISAGKTTESKEKSPIKHSHGEKRKSMEDKENVQNEDDDDDDVKIVESPDEKRSDRRHRRRRRHGSKHDIRGSSSRRHSRSERGEERGSRSKHRDNEILREDAEVDKKKKKITRKEFEERMKRAKLNRKYRKRREGSEEEINEKEKRNEENSKKEKENVTEETKTGGEEDVAEKEVSEKEEGEWDSNEEEEGQCSSSGSTSYYSDNSDPGKSRGSLRKRSLSGSKSRSRSGSPSCEQRSSRRVPRVPIKTVPVGTVRMPLDEKEQKSGKLLSEDNLSTTQTKKKEEEEENWGQKCDIEFVDSEEDFDGENNGSKIPKKLGISFSVKKKVIPSINQKDIDDLPMKKRNPLDDLPPKKKDNQILISSDSEVEDKETPNKNVNNLSKCQDLIKETEVKDKESNKSESVIIIPEENVVSIETVEKNTVSKTKDQIENDKKTDKLCSDELNLEKSVENELLGLQSKSDNKETSSETKLISEEINVHKEIVNPAEELVTESNIDFDKNNQLETERIIVSNVTDKNIQESNEISDDSGKNEQLETDNTEAINIKCNYKDKNRLESNEIISEDGHKKNKENQTDNIEMRNLKSNDKDKKTKENNEIKADDGDKNIMEYEEKLTDESNKTKKVVADKIDNHKPEPRTTRRRTRASKRIELEQKSKEDEDIENIYDVKKFKKKQDKERKLALENEKRILDFENEFEDPKDVNDSEDNKSKNTKNNKETHISQTDEKKDLEETISKPIEHELPSEENSTTKTEDSVKNDKNVEKIGTSKDSEESFKEFDSRNEPQDPNVLEAEFSSKSSKDIHLTTKSSSNEVYRPEECLKMQFGVSALDLTICKNKESVSSKQVTSDIALEVGDFYHPDISTSSSVQDLSVHTTKTQDMDDEEEIDVVGGVEDEEIDVVGVDDDNIASMRDDNATMTGMDQFVVAQDYPTDKRLTKELRMITNQNKDIDKQMSNIDDKTVTHESKKVDESPGDFYRGIDELAYSDEEKVQDEVDIEQLRNSHVEPIRIETGLIRKKVPAKPKNDEVQYPDKSWSKDKRKKEKTKDTLVLDSIGSLCSRLPRENTSKCELLEEESSHTPEVTGKEDNSDDDCSRGSSKCLSEASKIIPEEESESRSSTQSKGANKEMEIIGEIEATTADNDEIDLGRSSWSMRWLQSEKVQKVVSSSKMLSRVRKKIQQKDKATKDIAKQNETEPENLKPKEPTKTSVIGSIEEYERLFGKKTNTEDLKNKIESTSPTATAIPAIVTESNDPSIGLLTDAPSCTDVTDATNASQTSAAQHTTTSKVPIIDSDSEGDSEEEALWSKIMGK